MITSMTRSHPFTYSLDGWPISTLGLSAKTEEKLRRLEISTLEQLAKLALNKSLPYKREAIESIRVELSARLASHTVWCFSTTGFAVHFIIRVDNLFFFKASTIPDDQKSWTCTYQWQLIAEDATSYDALKLFCNPLNTAEIHTTILGREIGDTSVNDKSSDHHNIMEEHHEKLNKINTENVSIFSNNNDISTNYEQPTSLLNLFPEVLETLFVLLNPRERRVLELRYGFHDGTQRTLEFIGEALSCTRARIGQIEQNAFRKIRAVTSGMQRIHQALATLESVLEQSNGALPIAVAAQKLGIVTESINSYNPINEAYLRFLLSFSPDIDIPKGIPLVALRHSGYKAMFDALPGLASAIQRLLRKASRPLALETIIAELENNARLQEEVAKVPRSVLLDCLSLLPQIAVDDQGCYFLLGQIFDVSTSRVRRTASKIAVENLYETIDQLHTDISTVSFLTNQVVSVTEPMRSWDSYDIWNHAIATYVTAGAQRGSTVYLSIDDEVIEQIQQRLQTHKNQLLEAFLTAVKQRIVLGRHVELSRIRGRNRHSEPNGIAFLAVMVLAASRMVEDEEEEIASSNYFARFCEVLDIDQDGGRPLGMRSGAEAEEPLWREWIVWLGEIGLLSSARPGEGATRYTSYPISQTLLRRTDRERLRRQFHESSWPRNWDVDTLIHAVRREMPYLTKHLRTLLGDHSQRALAITEAIYEVYEAWGSSDTSSQIGGNARGYNLLADLWRSEDPLSGMIEYSLYPRSPRRHQFDMVIVDIDGRQHSLVAERPGRYMPICVVNEQQLNQGVRYPIQQPDELEALILPRRSFWLLSPDPNNPDSGIYVSWGTVPLGTPFMILCRNELIADLEKLRTERLIEWSGEPQTLPSFQEWVEVNDCLVISPTWDGVEIEHRDLHDALRPKDRLSISLSGGLRAPQGGWLADLGPKVTIFGFPRDAELRVIRISDNRTILEETRLTNQPFEVIWPTPGDYLVEAIAESRTSQYLVKIVDWDDLEAMPVHDLQWLQLLDGMNLCGALLRMADMADEEG